MEGHQATIVEGSEALIPPSTIMVSLQALIPAATIMEASQASAPQAQATTLEDCCRGATMEGPQATIMEGPQL